jgi:hypothetical protein
MTKVAVVHASTTKQAMITDANVANLRVCAPCMRRLYSFFRCWTKTSRQSMNRPQKPRSIVSVHGHEDRPLLLLRTFFDHGSRVSLGHRSFFGIGSMQG